MGSSQSTIPNTPTPAPALSAAPTPSSSSASSPEQSTKPKPCCVCKDEKAARDDCMLFSRLDDPEETECKPLVDQYKACMAGYGFKI